MRISIVDDKSPLFTARLTCPVGSMTTTVMGANPRDWHEPTTPSHILSAFDKESRAKAEAGEEDGIGRRLSFDADA
jgi:hypothetical protein